MRLLIELGPGEDLSNWELAFDGGTVACESELVPLARGFCQAADATLCLNTCGLLTPCLGTSEDRHHPYLDTQATTRTDE
jgi:hypothetical protein